MEDFIKDWIKFSCSLSIDTIVITALSGQFKNAYTWEFIGMSATVHY